MQNNNQKLIAGAILIAGILVAGSVLLRGTKAPTNALLANAPTADNNYNIKPVSLDDHIIGKIDAEIIIVEYSDFECPFCKNFHETMHKVVNNSAGKVAWVYRHYPIPQLHSKAFQEAEATECASEQGGNEAFWKYADRIFEITPSNNGLEMTELPKIAREIGLNVESFNVCLENGKYKNLINESVKESELAGVNATPSSFILQKGSVIGVIPGAEPYETLMQRLSEIK